MGTRIKMGRWEAMDHVLAHLHEIGKMHAGVTKEPTERPPFKLAGNKAMHREVQELRLSRKALFHASDPLNEGQKSQLQSLKQALHKLLKRSPLPSFADPTDCSSVDSFMTESASLIKQRLTKIDKEVESKKNQNIKEMCAKLQARYGEAGSKMMKRILGKMGAPQDLWGIDTNHPDCIKLKSLDLSPTLCLMRDSKAISVHQDSTHSWLQCAALKDVLPLAEHCFATYPHCSIEILTAVPLLVTSACDKLCAEEKFFGENALSKQACCATC